MTKNEKKKGKTNKRINSSVRRRRVLLQRNIRKQVDDDLEFKLGISIGGDREPPQEHMVGVVFRSQVL